MNKSKLKSYAPQARKDFIAMVQSRAAQLGIAEVNGQLQVQPCEVQGQVAIIAGQAFPAKIANQRQALVGRMQKEGFAATVDAIAYTWFNRFAALRYMELHNYLGHGQRVLSSVVDGGLPDILTHALELVSAGDLLGVSVDDVSQLKLAGKDGELYKRMLVAQCNQLAGHMGFLFERIDDDSELLLPDNLLRTDSVVRKLVDSIDEADWDQVEIIGWLYQFYISEKKDQVIGKVVKSADIPAATQLFTPNWIVKYLVQNSVGRLWLQANPGSALASQMAYYIQPAEQTPEVNDELTALVQARISEDGDTLNPESITVLDPACGSGHILVEAYDLLKAIYLERGYRERDIPRLILQKNLFGLDIDDRAAQLAAFALLMKARADDRRLFNEPIQLNVLALQESAGLDAAQLAQDLGLNDAAERNALNTLLSIFTQAKTFGSLLQIPNALAQVLPQLAARIATAQTSGDLYAQSAAATLQPLLQQAQVLARQYDAVVANPPYMGSKVMPAILKDGISRIYADSASDLYAAFIYVFKNKIKTSGFLSLITLHSWISLSSFESLRRNVISGNSISSFVYVGYNTFPELNSKIAQGCIVVLAGLKIERYLSTFIGLNNLPQSYDKQAGFLEMKDVYLRNQDDFLDIPGACVGYWVSDGMMDVFRNSKNLETVAPVRQGFQTGDNDKYLRYWFEVDFSKIKLDAQSKEDVFQSMRKWVPYNKGGSFRRWYGNNDYVVAFDEKSYAELSVSGNCLPSRNLYFKAAVTWSALTSSYFGARFSPPGFTFSAKGACAFPNDADRSLVLSILNSKVASEALKILSSTLDFNVGSIRNIPLLSSFSDRKLLEENTTKAVQLSKQDWDANEVSWDFLRLALTADAQNRDSLPESWLVVSAQIFEAIEALKEIEDVNNRILINSYGLAERIEFKINDNEISLYRPEREKDMQRLVSYVIGCMMGRYSLDEPSLVYAHAGNVGFDPQRYTRFAADADGIVPVSDLPWFPDDATQRVKEFLVAVWGQDTLAENLAWLADSLGRKADESPEDALRRYISGSFFKDHCQTYKKRPIYWLFSSGKQKAFEALVYLHRYNDTTLARMRAEYVVPLTGRMAERIQLLEDDALKATTSASRKAIDKQIDKLKKKLEELRQYDEKLRHFADQRITLDLDDGVKVNYGKFGDLLDNVKGITGGAGDD